MLYIHKLNFCIFILVLVSMLLNISCSRYLVQSRSSVTPRNQIITEIQNPESYKTTIELEWRVADDTLFDAQIGVSDGPTNSIDSKVGSRVTIKDKRTGQTVYEEAVGDTPLSMYSRYLNDDIGNALVINWGGGSADRIEILNGNRCPISPALNEHYRIDAALLDLSGEGNINVLITTGVGGTGPFYTTRYEWRNGKYEPIAKVPYSSLTKSIQDQFAKHR